MRMRRRVCNEFKKKGKKGKENSEKGVKRMTNFYNEMILTAFVYESLKTYSMEVKDGH